MSDIPQRTNRGYRKFQFWFSYILFSSLIVFDIFAFLNTIEPLVSADSLDEQTNNSSMVEMANHTFEEEVIHLVKELKDFHAANNVTLDLMSKMEIYLDWVAHIGAQESKEVIMATLEVLFIAILILVDLLALLGLKRRQACLLVPWMMVYFTRFCACYFQALVLLIEQADKKYHSPSITSIFFSLGTAVVFNFAWVFVCSIFKELIKDQQQKGRPGSTQV